MPVDSIQSATSTAWAQLQQVQAERAAEQAVARARGLQVQARSAEAVADRAQENARVVRTQSNQADGDAAQANRSVAAMKSMSTVQVGLADIEAQTQRVLSSDLSVAAAPVVNAYGETTGSIVNVTA